MPTLVYIIELYCDGWLWATAALSTSRHKLFRPPVSCQHLIGRFLGQNAALFPFRLRRLPPGQVTPPPQSPESHVTRHTVDEGFVSSGCGPGLWRPQDEIHALYKHGEGKVLRAL
jgi:hypothetical protein